MIRRDERSPASRRLKVLRLARKLGVSEACRRGGMDRTSFYKWKKRYEHAGLAGLVDRPPVHKSHPQTTRTEHVELLLALARLNPLWKPARLKKTLQESGVFISLPTIAKILRRAVADDCKQGRFNPLHAEFAAKDLKIP